MNLAEILNQIKSDSAVNRLSIPENWHQGRTAYGGLSTAIAYQAAKVSNDDLPPLASAQIAFIGPLAGEVEIRTQLLRRGRNTAFIRAEIFGEGGLGLSVTFIFAAQRESHFAYHGIETPDFPPIPKDGETRSGSLKFFSGHLHYAEQRQPLNTGNRIFSSWQRFAERDGIDPFAELLAIGDALPPAAMGFMQQGAPLSSMNWQINMLTAAPQTQNGWWFLESDVHHADNGGSSQFMTTWNSEGQAVMIGMQSIAIFG